MSQRRTQPVRRDSAPAQRYPSDRRYAPVRRPKPSRLDWLKRQLRKRPLPVWVVVTIDVLVFAVALNVFSLFHHVIPRNVEPVGISSSRENMAAQANPVAQPSPTAQEQPEASVAPAATDASVATQVPEPTATPDPVGYFGTKFADRFTSGEVNQDAWHYQSANLNINNSVIEYCGTDVFISDIYVRDISSFATAFAKDRYGRNYSEEIRDMAVRANAIVSINGDYYGNSDDGAIIRNGTLYREDSYVDCDMCVLYWDGTMKTFPQGQFDARAEMEAGAYQSWAFGPMLLDANGQAMTSFNSSVNPDNPRTAIGYFEPGHYCFVVVDGRTAKSEGISTQELSELMYSLGCKVAYNLDGGKTSQMYWGTNLVNNPSGGGRNCSDIVLIREPV